jgi:hypothetical protein
VRLWDADSGAAVVVLMADGTGWLGAGGGMCRHGGAVRSRIALVVRHPASPGTTFYCNPGRLLDLCERPELLSRSTVDDPPSFEELIPDPTWRGGTPWDGQPVVLGGAAPSDAATNHAARIPEPVPPVATAGSVDPGFSPGRALTSETLPGREDLLIRASGLVRAASPLVLHGPRRAGKTSTLNTLAARHHAAGWAVYRTSLEAATIRSADGLAGLLAASTPVTPRSGADPAEAFQQRISGEKTLLIVDEIFPLAQAGPAVLAWLRELGHHGAAVVLAGTHMDWQLVCDQAREPGRGSFVDDVTPLDLGPLSEPDAAGFLVAAAAPAVDLAGADVVGWILERCGSWPFYLQVVGSALVAAAQAGDRRPLTDQAALDALYRARLLDDRDRVFRNRWDELPRDAHAAFLREQPVPPDAAALRRDERRAARFAGLLSPADAWLDDRPFYDWIRARRHDLTDPSAG